ncbi:MerR family transcriptional regulator [Promicromonospora sp. NPDC023987]|uniref:MerR family transcriptional regulator n=1 Tax=Promicromonospora sp. NPDC023987 TaxID=3155360 RepID=UPI0033CAB79D
MDELKIGELAERSGVPASTLRYYEAEGLLPATRAGNGYRLYGQQALDRLAFITQAKHLDLPLTDIRELATVWESESCHSVRSTYRPMLAERIQQTTQRLTALQGLHETLTAAIDYLDALPDRDAPCDASCAFLDPPRRPLPLVEATPAPVACTLGAGDYAKRVADWHDLLRTADLVEVTGGVRVTLPTADLERTTSLAAAEQECCAFFSFRLDLHGPTFDLTITAPPEAAPLLADLLPTHHATPTETLPR